MALSSAVEPPCTGSCSWLRGARGLRRSADSVGEDAVVEVHSVLRGDDHADAFRTGLLHEREQLAFGRGAAARSRTTRQTVAAPANEAGPHWPRAIS